MRYQLHQQYSPIDGKLCGFLYGIEHSTNQTEPQ